MKLVIISDSHEKHRQIKLPEGDIFAGTLLAWGEEKRW